MTNALHRWFIYVSIVSMLYVPHQLYAACTTPTSEKRIWDNVLDDLQIDITTLSKVCIIESILESIDFNCSAIDLVLEKIATIESLVEDMDPRVISIESTVNVIDTRTSSIYNTDQTILSVVESITAQDCNSGLELILSGLDVIERTDQTILSKVMVIDTRTSSIYSLDQVIASNVNNIYNLEQTINSKIDNININNSLINVIDTRTSSIFSLDQTIASIVSNISSKVDVDIAIDRSIQSTVNVIDTRTSSIYNLDQTINSKIDALQSSVSNTQNCCSTINVIDTRTTSIYSLDQTIASIVSNTSSKVDVDIVIDKSIQSVVNVIDTRTSSIFSLDQTIASIVSNISSKVDVDIAIDKSIFSAISALSSCCTGTTANEPFVSIYGSQIVEERLDNISIQFQYGIPASTVNSNTQGGGTLTTANSTAVLSTAASANSFAQLQTKGTIIYRSGHEAYTLFTVAFTGSFTASSSQFIGPIDYQNGFAVGFDGTTFGVTRRTNTVNSFTPQSSFNGDKLDGTGPSQFTYTPALLNVFRISYGYLGSSIIKFQIMNNYGNWITFHTIRYPNTSASPSINQPFLPITARVENLAGATSVLTLRTASWNAGIIGSANNSSYRYYQTNNTVVNPSTSAETLVLIIRNKSVFNSQPNKIQVRCAAFGGGSIGTASESSTIRLRKNATVTSPTFTDIDPSNSVIEVSTAGTFTAGTGTVSLIRPCVNTGNGPNIDFIPQGTYEVIILPGETLTITAISNSGGQIVLCGVAWEEQF